MIDFVEYRVRPVTRFVVTRFHKDPNGSGGVEMIGEFPNEQQANKACLAFQISSIKADDAEPQYREMTRVEALEWLANLQAVADDETMPFSAVRNARQLLGLSSGFAGLMARQLGMERVNSMRDDETIELRVA